MTSQTEETRKVALVTGITGQDGSYLAELLLEKGYEVSILEINVILVPCDNHNGDN